MDLRPVPGLHLETLQPVLGMPKNIPQNNQRRRKWPLNLIGPTVVRLRAERNWTQDDLVAHLQIVGDEKVTRSVVANIETRRSTVTDFQVSRFAEAFGVSMLEMFPSSVRSQGIPRKSPASGSRGCA
ncbi:MAG: helix-turn-helix transcriptional regulator [Verrucomicrobiales bacterium]|nr:helix-turn-helix transcriptional regulator [Verrucomicrobiales bacterium]